MKTFVLLVSLSLGGAAYAQTSPLDNQPAVREETMVMSSPRTTTGHALIMPEGWEAGAALVLVTADGGLAGRKIAFTDVGFLRLGGRVSFDGDVELVGSVTFLPKQPSYTDEDVFQGGSLLLRFGVGDAFALDVGAGGGPLLGGDGRTVDGQVALEAKTSVDETLDFSGGLAALTTAIDPGGGSKSFWLAEAVLHADIELKAPRGEFAVVLGAAYALPFAHTSTPEVPNVALNQYDPQARLDVHVAAVYGMVPDWDIYADYAIIDRGDLSNPATTLPILDGGFDQTQLLIGVIHRPSSERRRHHGY